MPASSTHCGDAVRRCHYCSSLLMVWQAGVDVSDLYCRHHSGIIRHTLPRGFVLSRPRSEDRSHCGQSVFTVDAPSLAVHRSVHSVKIADKFHLVLSCLVVSCLESSSVRGLTTLWTVYLHCRRSSTCRISCSGSSPVRDVVFLIQDIWSAFRSFSW